MIEIDYLITDDKFNNYRFLNLHYLQNVNQELYFVLFHEIDDNFLYDEFDNAFNGILYL